MKVQLGKSPLSDCIEKDLPHTMPLFLLCSHYTSPGKQYFMVCPGVCLITKIYAANTSLATIVSNSVLHDYVPRKAKHSVPPS